jgi:phosphoglycolate phosphatase
MEKKLVTDQTKPNGFCWYSDDAYLFDIDGTLLRCYDRTHRYALHRAMRDVYGVETTIDGIAYHGKTDLGILRAALERVGVTSAVIDDRMAEALAVTRRHAADNANLFTPTIMPGIPEILESLRSHGKLLGICSGNLESIGWVKVRAAGLVDYFEFGCFADYYELRECVFENGLREVRRLHGPESTVCFVGDTPEDVRAARAVGAHIIAVGTGVYPVAELAAQQPDACISSCAELLATGPSAHLHESATPRTI